MTRELPSIKARRIGIVELPPERPYKYGGIEPFVPKPKKDKEDGDASSRA